MTLKPPGSHMEATPRMKAVYDMAAGVSINHDTHPKHYFRSGRELIRSAASYQEDDQTEHAYVLYIRFLTIFLEKIRLHPNYKDISPSERKVMTDFCTKILPQAEYLKKELLKKYATEHEEYLVEETERLRQAEEQRQRELEEQKRRAQERAKSDNKVIPAKILPSAPPPSAPAFGDPGRSTYDSTPFVPSVPFGLPQVEQPSSGPPAWQYDPTPKEKIREPDVTPFTGLNIPVGPSGIGIPSVDRSTKPSRVLTPMSSGLRPLIIPADLPATFLRYAQANTARNTETCGLLTGRISGARLLITDLIIPKQTGSSDTCVMSNETEIFNLQDKYNLISFGWIHTHPSQTAFLSSIDMHTHYSYQVMMPEAIAIVCAPKHNQTGIFTLTPYEGMEEIGTCNLNGFHPHKATGLFCDAPHCSLESTLQVKVHDLR